MINYKSRTYGTTKEISISELKKLFGDKRLSYLQVVVLFGSRATQSATSQSDYDFAVSGECDNAPFGIQAKSWIDIATVLGVDDYDIDVVNLETANDLMKDSIREKYVVLKGEPDAVSRLLAKNT